MKGIRDFREFINESIVKKQNPNKSRANFLIKESERSYKLLFEMIEKMKVNDDNANMFVRLCYDILMEIIRAKMLVEGYIMHQVLELTNLKFLI